MKEPWEIFGLVLPNLFWGVFLQNFDWTYLRQKFLGLVFLSRGQIFCRTSSDRTAQDKFKGLLKNILPMLVVTSDMSLMRFDEEFC